MAAKFNKLWNDVQVSARNYLYKGLQYSVKAVGNTATRLKAFEETLKVRAEKLNQPAVDSAPVQK